MNLNLCVAGVRLGHRVYEQGLGSLDWHMEIRISCSSPIILCHSQDKDYMLRDATLRNISGEADTFSERFFKERWRQVSAFI